MGEVGIILLAVVAAIVVGSLAIAFVVVPVFKGIRWLLRHLWTFIRGEVVDTFRIVGSIALALCYVPLVVGNIVVGRWSAATHFGRGISHEIRRMGGCLYRVVIGHPARLLLLGGITEGLEQRLPEMLAQAPTSDTPSARTGQFDGYRIVGSIAAGGSGAKLYIAEPDAMKLAGFARSGVTDVRQVVIKSFSLQDGSSLPQIVREGRSLDAAKKLGLILDHDLSPQRFHYVMRFVPGQSLTIVTRQLHSMGDGAGLAPPELRLALGYVADLIATIDTYHRGGLWHKDVKPDNIIVDGKRAHLVDFGLITPLRSAMTLTTHGTEYFRDPEMVRLALRGVKVHEVDGSRFDIYGAGAVLYAVIEDQFPAHGVLSPFSRSSPEAVRWIVRRAMADYDKRYGSAAQMLADLTFVMNARDPNSVKPFELPSMRAAAAEMELEAGAAGVALPDAALPDAASPDVASGAQGQGENAARAATPAVAAEPRVEPVAEVAMPAAASVRRAGQPRARAHEQLERARGRLEAARARAHTRMAKFERGPRPYKNGVTGGVAVALVVAMGLGGLAVSSLWRESKLSPEGDGSPALSMMADLSGGAAAPMPPLPPMPPAAPTPPAMPKLAAVGSGDAGDAAGAAEAGHDEAEHVEARAHAMRELAEKLRAEESLGEMEEIIKDAAERAHSVDRSALKLAAIQLASDAATLAKGSGTPAKQTRKSSRASRASDSKAPMLSGTVLVMNELMPPLSDEVESVVRALSERLTPRGVRLVGKVPGERSAEELSRETDLIVGAIAARGTVTLDSADAERSLTEWLRENAGSADVIAWISLSPRDGKTPEVRFFLPPATAPNAATAQTLAKTMHRVLSPSK